MMKKYKLLLVLTLGFLSSCRDSNKLSDSAAGDLLLLSFPSELVDFQPHGEDPIFTGSGSGNWDEHIRERGYILKEDGVYKMWYTGYQNEASNLSLGYATSLDGIHWDRYPGNPIFDRSWTEDMMVVMQDGLYQMFAEGRGDLAHRLSSEDGIHWTDHGSLVIRQTDGSPLSEGPYGTPTVWLEEGIWYLFYERNDLGIWLATSKDLKVWVNVQDEPVIEMGPEEYDRFGLAVNQVVKYKGTYYAYYHGTAFEDWHEWSTNVAASKDLVHWTKFDQNPIMTNNRSSGIIVPEGTGFLLYTMHDKVEVFFPKKD